MCVRARGAIAPPPPRSSLHLFSSADARGAGSAAEPHALRGACLLQVASLPSHWSPSAPLALKLALAELLLGQIAAAPAAAPAGGDDATPPPSSKDPNAPLAEAARKLVPKLLPAGADEERDARVKALLAALTPAAAAEGGEEAVAGSPAEAATELAALLVEALRPQLPAEKVRWSAAAPPGCFRPRSSDQGG